MDNRNFYSMPAPWGGIVLREENGELASICPTIASIQAPSPAPLAIADAMQQLEAVLTVPQATSEELRETLFATQVFRKLPDSFAIRVLNQRMPHAQCIPNIPVIAPAIGFDVECTIPFAEQTGVTRLCKRRRTRFRFTPEA